jgi:hypothetical protein
MEIAAIRSKFDGLIARRPSRQPPNSDAANGRNVMVESGAVVCLLFLLIRFGARPLSGRNSTYRPAQILEAGFCCPASTPRNYRLSARNINVVLTLENGTVSLWTYSRPTGPPTSSPASAGHFL